MHLVSVGNQVTLSVSSEKRRGRKNRRGMKERRGDGSHEMT